MQSVIKNKNINPFPGLRPFGIEESHLFFGREGQTEVILNYLSENRFAAVTGASGSGKSSLIYCGVIPLLYGGFIPDAGTNWKVVTTRPGSTPVWNLAESLVKANTNKENAADKATLTEYCYSVLRRHSMGLIDAVEQLKLAEGQNLLLVIDQFEELFRYKESRNKLENHKDEPETFIRLLVNTVLQTRLPVYIVVTMRSDFIGHCSEFQGLTSLINQSNYLIPQMTRADYELVIKSPIQIAGAEIEARLLQQILNSLDENPDQLPVLQHAMMRTWEFWARNTNQQSPISVRDYMAAGKIENALSLHANEAYSSLDDKERQLCKALFKGLTEKGQEGKGIRRPTTVNDLSAMAQVQPSEVIKVIEVFRAPGRTFLTPSIENRISNESVIDISHESLMRVWDKLRTWVDEEASSSQMYLRLIELAGFYQTGKVGLMRPPDLHLASSWKKNQQPNKAWASRYNPAIEKAIVYLNSSEKKFQSEEETKIKIRRRELARTRRIAILMSVFAMALLLAMFYAYDQRGNAIMQKDRAEQYARVLEARVDTAVEVSQSRQSKVFELLLERKRLDSISSERQMKLFQSEANEQDYQKQLGELARITEELELEAVQEREEKEIAESQARLALIGKSESESEIRAEKRLRMLSLSETVALRAMQTNDKQLSGLLAYHAYLINRENGGQINHPEIYRGLFFALRELKGWSYNTLSGHSGAVKSILFDPARNTLYSSDNGGNINKWSFRKERPTPTSLVTNEYANTCLAITVDGRWMACGSENKTVQLFNALQPTQAPRIYNAHDGAVTSVKFIPGRNAMVTTGKDNKVKFWDLLTNDGEQVYENSYGINYIDVNPGGQNILIAAGDNSVYKWEVGADKPKAFYRHSQPVMSVVFDLEGERVAVGDRSGNIIILNARTGRLIKSMKAHSSRILDLKYSPDNRLLASSGMDGVIRIWNVTDWNDKPIEIREHESWVESITFSPDGNNLLSTSNNGNLIYIWPVKADQMQNEICKYLTRQLTQQEWRSFMGKDIEYRQACP